MTITSRTATALLVAALGMSGFVGCSPVGVSSDRMKSGDSAQQGDVVAVVDGDTIKVDTGASVVRVRIIGIDTPEIGRDGEPSECYAEAARDFLDNLVYGQHVALSPDLSQADVDRYGRLLRHVYLDGESVALTELAAGAGREYTYDAPYAGQADYRAAEEGARSAGLGLWSACE